MFVLALANEDFSVFQDDGDGGVDALHLEALFRKLQGKNPIGDDDLIAANGVAADFSDLNVSGDSHRIY